MSARFFSFVFALLLSSELLLAQSIVEQAPEIKPEAPKRSWELESKVEIRNTDDRQDRLENRDSIQLHEVSLGLKGRIQKELGYFIEGSAEQLDGESEFFFKQVYLDILPEDRWVHLRAGQFYYPVGWLSQEDNWFISKPSYYQILFKGDKPLDTGAAIEIHPFSKPWVFLSGSCFSGRIFREEDGRQGDPEDRPCEASLRSRTPWFEAYYTYFQHHLAFYDPVKVHGVGLNTEFSPIPKWNRLQLGAVTEFFSIEEVYETGGVTLSEAWMAYVYAQVYQFRVGWRGSETLRNLELASGQKTHTLIREDLFRAEAEVFKNLTLVYEDELVEADITYEDRWALRLIADWKFE